MVVTESRVYWGCLARCGAPRSLSVYSKRLLPAHLMAVTFTSMGLALATSFVAYLVWFAMKRLRSMKALYHIPGPEPSSLVMGDIGGFTRPDGWEFLDGLIDHYGGVSLVKGFLGDPMLHVYDPKALHHIIVKDQDTYEETESFTVLTRVTFGMGLFATNGNHHRKQRKLLNPAFSTTHMREMVPTFYEVASKTVNTLLRQVSKGEKEIDMLAWMARTALELLGRSGLGYSFDTLEENSIEHPFVTSVKSLVRALNKFTISRFIVLPLVVNIGSPQFQRRVVNMLPWKDLHEVRDIVDVMHNTSVEIIESKKRALASGDADALKEEVGRGKDVISLLVKANMAATAEDKLPESELYGQISTLAFAAMDTTSNALSRVLHLLSKNTAAQERLRAEVREARIQNNGDDLDHDQLNALPYLDAICRETLRLYPPLSFVFREARKDGILPLHRPLKTNDGAELKEIFVPKGTMLIVSITGCNRNPDLWGHGAGEWNPDRWLAPFPATLSQAGVPGVYSNLMTFIGGGRACIGFKFAQLEMKVVLSRLIETFQFSPSKKEIVWRQHGIAQPAVRVKNNGQEEFDLQLPLKVNLAK